MHVLITYYHSLSTVVLVLSPDPTQKQSGEPRQIPWASTHSHDIQRAVAMFKTVYARPAQKRYGYLSRNKKIFTVDEVL